MVAVSRSGHSLPELIVATTFLAVALVAVGGTGVLGARWMARGAEIQTAVRLAEVVLDSVGGDPGAGSGETEADGLRIRWTASGDGIRVEVSRPGLDSVLVALEGARLPAIPVLPDAGSEAPGP